MTDLNNKSDLFTLMYFCYVKILMSPLKCVATEKSLRTAHQQYEPYTV